MQYSLGSVLKKFGFGTGLGLDKGDGLNPSRDWKVLCLLLFLGVLVALVFDLYLVYSAKSVIVSGIVPTPGNGEVTLDLNRLERLLKATNSRNTYFNELLNNRPSFVDPSL